MYISYHVSYDCLVSLSLGGQMVFVPFRANLTHLWPTSDTLMFLCAAGMACQECNQLIHSGNLLDYASNLYNLLDFVLITVYIATFTLRYWTMFKVGDNYRTYNSGENFIIINIVIEILNVVNSNFDFF